MSIGGFSIEMYGVMIALAVSVSYYLTQKYRDVFGLKNLDVDRLLWYTVIGGVIGARAYHVADLWQEYYRYDVWESFFIWQGGLGILGALMGGVFGVYLFARQSGLDIFKLLNLVALSLPLAQSIGRWGNYFNNEIVGKNNEPLFLYESVANLTLFSLLWLIVKRGGTNLVFGLYFVGYGLIRVVLEPLRTSDAIWSLGEVSVASMISLVMIVIGIYILIRQKAPTNRGG
jgi:phosphatidylglycerol---prolipoprotein diacylglyceryl transferase